MTWYVFISPYSKDDVILTRYLSILSLKIKESDLPEEDWYCSYCSETLQRRKKKRESVDVKKRKRAESLERKRDAKMKKKQESEQKHSEQEEKRYEAKAKRVLHLKDRIVKQRKVAYRDKDEEKLGKLVETLSKGKHGVQLAMLQKELAKIEKEERELKKKMDVLHKRKFPIEDTELHSSLSSSTAVFATQEATTSDSLEPTSPSASIRKIQIPDPHEFHGIPPAILGSMLSVWTFVQVFHGNVLSISPFTIEEFRSALLYTEDVELMTQLHLSLLSLVLENREQDDYSSDNDGRNEEAEDVNDRWKYELKHAPLTLGIPNSKILNRFSWPSVLQNYLISIPRYAVLMPQVAKDALAALQSTEYSLLSLGHKVVLLRFLVQLCLKTKIVRQVLRANLQERVKRTTEFNKILQQEKREEREAADKLRREEREAAEKIRLDAKLKKEMKLSMIEGGDHSSAEVSPTASSVEESATTASVDFNMDTAEENEDDSATESEDEDDISDEEEEEEEDSEGEDHHDQNDNDANDFVDADSKKKKLSRTELLAKKRANEARRDAQRIRRDERERKKKWERAILRKKAQAKDDMKRAMDERDLDGLNLAIEKAKEAGLEQGRGDRMTRTTELHQAMEYSKKLEVEILREYEVEVRYEEFQDAMSQFFVRCSPLGRDRDFRRYWRLVDDPLRIYVEEPQNMLLSSEVTYDQCLSNWYCYESQDDVVQLIQALDHRGIREHELKMALQTHRTDILRDMPLTQVSTVMMMDVHKKQPVEAKEGEEEESSLTSQRKTRRQRAEEEESFLSWKNKKGKDKSEAHQYAVLERLVRDLKEVEEWMARRLYRLESNWTNPDAQQHVFRQLLEQVQTLEDIVDPILMLENAVFEINHHLTQALTPVLVASKEEHALVVHVDEENNDDDEEEDNVSVEEEEEEDDLEHELLKKGDDGTKLWPTRYCRKRWINAVRSFSTSSALVVALATFVERCEMIGISKDDLVAKNMETARQKRSRKERAALTQYVEEADSDEFHDDDDDDTEDDEEYDNIMHEEAREPVETKPKPKSQHQSSNKRRKSKGGVAKKQRSSSRKSCASEMMEPMTIQPIEPLMPVPALADDPWDTHCFVCGIGGELLCCDGCPHAFHLACIHDVDMTTLPHDDWFCNECESQKCGVCNKSRIKLDSHVICGSEDGTKGCDRVFHLVRRLSLDMIS